MQIKKEDVVRELKKCTDPEIGINLVDLGLIYNIEIDDKNNVTVTMTMTSPMCPVTSIILADVQLRLEKLEGVGQIKINLVWDPMWSPDMISQEAKLNMQGGS
ncbi:MAG: metal-sulfur cluster assembly factor [Candidatus Micrarchaeia archaeon]